MNYYNVAALKNGISVQPGLDGNRTFTWGGKLTENICQATGREIQVDGWIRALKAFDSEELSMLFHVHDEFVFEVDENIDDKKLAAILETPPEWGKTIPVEVEYEFSDHYKK
jgi:DNA polymerase